MRTGNLFGEGKFLALATRRPEKCHILFPLVVERNLIPFHPLVLESVRDGRDQGSNSLPGGQAF